AHPRPLHLVGHHEDQRPLGAGLLPGRGPHLGEELGHGHDADGRPGGRRAAMKVLELRNYLLKPGATADFIRYFEEHFLESQRDEGMHRLGQFEVVGEPNRFVWIRAFRDREARLRGLTGFYGGAFWLARRDEANAMMLEHHDVHLLRPLAPIAALTGG